MYHVRILDTAIHELSQLDKSLSRRIVKRINWLAAHLDEVKREALSGDLEGFYKLRVGDYRVIYEVLYGEKTIVIHVVGHRREIYRKR